MNPLALWVEWVWKPCQYKIPHDCNQRDIDLSPKDMGIPHCIVLIGYPGISERNSHRVR